jgi:predicted enzyme related to lactoylglutathione lyase
MSDPLTGDVGLNLPDVARAVPFYAGVFGWEVLHEGGEAPTCGFF